MIFSAFELSCIALVHFLHGQKLFGHLPLSSLRQKPTAVRETSWRRRFYRHCQKSANATYHSQVGRIGSRQTLSAAAAAATAVGCCCRHVGCKRLIPAVSPTITLIHCPHGPAIFASMPTDAGRGRTAQRSATATGTGDGRRRGSESCPAAIMTP
jgi:hypothetical protein